MDKAPDTLRITAAELAAIDTALEALETNLFMLISLDPREREGMNEMGEDTEKFCRQTLMRLLLNPHLGQGVASDLAQANEDMRTLDILRPRLQRLHRLGERAQDTRLMLGNYVIMASLVGYSVLEGAGKQDGLEELRDSIGYRRRSRRRRDDAARGAS